MAVTFGAAWSNSASGPGTTLDVTGVVTNVGSDVALAATVSWRRSSDSGNLTSVVYDPGGANEVTLTLGTDLVRSSARTNFSYAVGLTGMASATVRATFSSAINADDVTIGVMRLEGVDQSTPIGTIATANAFDTSISVSVTSGSTDELCVDGGGCDADRGWSAINGATERWEERPAGIIPASGQGSTEPGASGTVSMDHTLTNFSNNVLTGVSFKAAAGGGDVTGAADLTALVVTSGFDAVAELVGALALTSNVVLVGTGTVEGEVLGASALAVSVTQDASGSLDHGGATTLTATVTQDAVGNRDRGGATALATAVVQSAGGSLNRGGTAVLASNVTSSLAGVLDLAGQSSLNVVCTLTALVALPFEASLTSTVTMLAAGRLLWEAKAGVDDNWTSKSGSDDIWTPEASASDGWVPE